MTTIVLDTEADGLTPTRVWCAVTKTYPGKEVRKFVEEECYTKLPDYLRSCDRIIGHNIIGYEWFRIFPLLGITDIPVDRLIDTLVLSQLAKPMRRDGYGRHALDAWGWRLGVHKPAHDDWSKFSPEMLVRCSTDVDINYLLFRRLLKELKGFSKESSRLEHEIRAFLDEMKETGFYLNTPGCRTLHSEIFKKASSLRSTLTTTVPPLIKRGKLVPLLRKKDGTLNVRNQGRIKKWLDLNASIGSIPFQTLEDTVVGDYTLVEFNQFDPSSSDQIVKAMNRYGWKPTRKTKSKKTWAVTEENLDTLPASAPAIAQQIPEFLACESRHKMLKSWLNAVAVRNDSKIHGSVMPMGASTHRASHMDPNMANVPGIESKYYGVECRELLTVEDPENYRLLGCDAQGIQLRIFAHLTGSKEYAERVLDDPHSANLIALGVDKGPWDEESGTYKLHRQRAKKFVYAWLLGAGGAMAGKILHIPTAEAKEAIESFIANTPGLAKLKKYLRACAHRGWMPLVDGRRAWLPSEFAAMAMALQGNESVLMKRALVDWRMEYKRRELDVHPMAWVHDEVQAAVHKDHAEEAGELMNQAIRDAGVKYKTRCPMDGSYSIGLTWKDTH